jgi:hypothetical protein
MLIGLMSLPNQVVYMQFHPVAYMVKLNIEMSMANLIRKIAKATVDDRNIEYRGKQYSLQGQRHGTGETKGQLQSGNHASANAKIGTVPAKAVGDDFDGIRTTVEVCVNAENVPSVDGESVTDIGVYDGFDRRYYRPIGATKGQLSDDKLPLSPPEVVLAQFETHSKKGGSYA